MLIVVTMWEIETALIDDWLDSLEDDDYDSVIAALEFLAENGPGCGRPFVDTIRESRFPNMKELRPRSTNIRILFAFDPQRQAIMLTAGEKTNKWNRWYRDNIPLADELFAQHLKRIRGQ